MAKMKKLEDENIIIPKKSKEDCKTEEGVDSIKATLQEEMLKTLQEEVRQLHFKLRQKEQIILEFKRET